MDVTVADAPVGGVTVLTLHGELGVDTAQRMRAVLSHLISDSACRVVVDLSALSFCDSIGLSAFLDAHHRCAAAGGYLRLAAPTPFVLRGLAVVGLLRPIAVYETVRAACVADAAALCAPPADLGVCAAGRQPHPARRISSPAPAPAPAGYG